MKKILLVLFLLCLSNPAWAVTNWCNHANNVGCFLMEDATTETDRGGNTSNDLSVVSSPNTIPQSETKKFGAYSRDFELNESEWLEHDDGLETDISGENAQITFCLWVNPETATGTSYIGGKYATSEGARQYALAIFNSAAGKPVFAVSYDGTNATSLMHTTSMSVGTWYHLCGVYDDTNLYIYTDGSAVSTALNTGIHNSSTPFKIGSSGAPSYWDGLIDDVGVFDIALDSTDISDIMDNGLYQVAGVTNTIRGAIIRGATVH